MDAVIDAGGTVEEAGKVYLTLTEIFLGAGLDSR